MNKLFILDVAHGKSTPGKRSPDGKHLEYLWSREVCALVLNKAKNAGLDVVCPFLNHENEPGLSVRVRTYEKIPASKTKVMLSIHNNAQGSGEKWMNARGFSAYTSKGQTKSDSVAEIIIDDFIKSFPDIKVRTDKSDGDKDWEENFTVLMGRYLQVLIEVLFQDNKEDVQILSTESFKNDFSDMLVRSMKKIDVL